MYNPINYKKFELFLEEVNTQNSSKEIKLKDYQDKVNNYNSKKNSFKPILVNKEQKDWEELASKIIKGNVYLGSAWKIAKITKQVEDATEKIKSGDMSSEEVKELQEKIKEYQAELLKTQTALNIQIKTDLQAIKNF